jgi:hypothetical protein
LKTLDMEDEGSGWHYAEVPISINYRYSTLSQITDHVINWIEQDSFENLSLELVSWNYPQNSNSDCANELWILGTLKDPANDASYLPRLTITYDDIQKEHLERERRSRGNGSRF